jgi:hypothetical protein
MEQPLFQAMNLAQQNASQQSMHLTLGIRRHFQAFSQSDGVPPPAPARVTQTVETVEKGANLP